MKQILGRFLTQENRDFPADCEMLDYMQTNLAVVSILGNMVGDKAILSGCELEQNDTRRKPGYVFLKTKDFPNGEVLYWEGGAISGGIYLRQEPIAVSAQGYEYSQAYISRTLAPGIGLENYKWEDFRQSKTPSELEAYDKKQDTDILKLSPMPLGVVQLWAGTVEPDNYALCDGRNLKIAEYPELYAALGNTYNSTPDCNGSHYNTPAGSFRLPDLRGRFVVGYNPSDDDYKEYGGTGGEKKHTLTVDEIPPHDHRLYLQPWGNRYTGGGGADELDKGDSATGLTGGGASHENRPPFYTLAYIMRLK